MQRLKEADKTMDKARISVVGELPGNIRKVLQEQGCTLTCQPAPDDLMWILAAPNASCATDENRPLTVAVAPATGGDLQVGAGSDVIFWEQLLQLARKSQRLRREQDSVRQRLEHVSQKHRRLLEIGIALSSEKDLSRLLNRVLSEGRILADCEGASVFLVEKEPEKRLRFMVTQNDDATVDHRDQTFPLSGNSIAGFVALTGETVLIEDVYAIEPDRPFQFNREFDTRTGYRTRDLIALPMRNHQDEVIGVLQFLNSRTPGATFSSDVIASLRALASQAAVAIENTQLIAAIEQLFEGFVLASVKAIEARDPVTSGHSFRVADYTCALAMATEHQTVCGQTWQWQSSQLKELRYAALLHDFGKVGVREHILLKAAKLPPARLELLMLRIDWLMEHEQRLYWERVAKTGRESDDARRLLRTRMQELESWKELLKQANQPTVLPQEASHHLAHLAEQPLADAPWGSRLLDAEDFLCLSVPQGSLTEDERREIQSHVVHTMAYLRQIPWTGDLARIPDIAAAHHEKLDGSGYPFGLSRDEIPLQSRMMTIADIFDALTARDRPYKSSLPAEKALDILSQEARIGRIDAELLDLFIASEAYRATHPGAYGSQA